MLCKPVAFLSEKTKLPKGIVSTAAVLLLLAVIFLPIGYLVYKGICELASLITNYPALLEKQIHSGAVVVSGLRKSPA